MESDELCVQLDAIGSAEQCSLLQNGTCAAGAEPCLEPSDISAAFSCMRYTGQLLRMRACTRRQAYWIAGCALQRMHWCGSAQASTSVHPGARYIPGSTLLRCNRACRWACAIFGALQLPCSVAQSADYGSNRSGQRPFTRSTCACV